jgi:hypothetical protein
MVKWDKANCGVRGLAKGPVPGNFFLLTHHPIWLTLVAGFSLVASKFAVADEVIPRLVAASIVLTHVRATPRKGVSTKGRGFAGSL